MQQPAPSCSCPFATDITSKKEMVLAEGKKKKMVCTQPKAKHKPGHSKQPQSLVQSYEEAGMMLGQAVEVSVKPGGAEAQNIFGPAGVVFDPGVEKTGLEGYAKEEVPEEPGVGEAQEGFGSCVDFFDPDDAKIGQGEEVSDYLFHLEVNAHLERAQKLLAEDEASSVMEDGPSDVVSFIAASFEKDMQNNQPMAMSSLVDYVEAQLVPLQGDLRGNAGFKMIQYFLVSREYVATQIILNLVERGHSEVVKKVTAEVQKGNGSDSDSEDCSIEGDNKMAEPGHGRRTQASFSLEAG